MTAPPAHGASVTLHGVSKRHGAATVVREVSLAIAAGEFLAIVGASGAGKTTLLRMINRLVEPDAGEILVGDVDARQTPTYALRRQIGYVIQGVGLFPHLTIAENVAAVPRLLEWPRDAIEQRVREMLDLVELPHSEFGARLPATLSGGQRQRVGFARALAGRPGLVLMDEPFGALDPLTRDALANAYRGLHDRLALTTIMVTHDIGEAIVLADRIAVMQAGVVVAAGAPSELAANPLPYVQDLLAAPKRNAARMREKLGDAA